MEHGTVSRSDMKMSVERTEQEKGEGSKLRQEEEEEEDVGKESEE